MECTPDDSENIRVEVIKPEDRDAVLKVIKESFFKDEPLCKSLGIGDDSWEPTIFVAQYMGGDLCFKALNSRGEIVGVYLNEIVHKSEQKEHSTGNSIAFENKSLLKLIDFFDYVDERFNMFDMYPDVDKYLYHRILTVIPSYRTKNVGTRLTTHLNQRMKDMNIQLTRADTSSAYSARICENFGDVKVFELPYNEYVVNGERPIQPDPPHTSYRIYTNKRPENK